MFFLAEVPTSGDVTLPIWFLSVVGGAVTTAFVWLGKLCLSALQDNKNLVRECVTAITQVNATLQQLSDKKG